MFVKAVENPEEIDLLMEQNRQNTLVVLKLSKYIDID
jgi:hypothetical protein